MSFQILVRGLEGGWAARDGVCLWLVTVVLYGVWLEEWEPLFGGKMRSDWEATKSCGCRFDMRHERVSRLLLPSWFDFVTLVRVCLVSTFNFCLLPRGLDFILLQRVFPDLCKISWAPR